MSAPAALPASRVLWSAHGAQAGQRLVPEETAVAIVHDASTSAVMMATPSDLEDLAYGFSLTEGLVASPDEVNGVDVVETALGVEARVWLAPACGAALARRRRRIAGPTGCGLCGIDSLAEAVKPSRALPSRLRFTAADVQGALASLQDAQTLGSATRAVHAAGWWTPAERLSVVREDVGRHNALDKLAGALARRGPIPPGLVLLTSRVSVEMVQKAAVLGAEALVAISVPTALALRTASAAGMTLIAVAREDSFEVFTHGERLVSRRAPEA